MPKQAKQPPGNHTDSDLLLELAHELHNGGADWWEAYSRAMLELRIREWPSRWGDNLQIFIYGDFDPPEEEMHIESLGITISPEKLENTIIRSALCVLKATVTIDEKNLDAVIDASRRVNVLLGAWALATWGNSACGWWCQITHGIPTGIVGVLDNDRLPSLVEGILQLPQELRTKVDAALYWVRKARESLFEDYRADLLRMYAAYWNAFECLVEATISIAGPPIRPSRTDKQKLVNQFMAQCSGRPTVADIQRCYHEIVDPGFVRKARHALEVCFRLAPFSDLASKYARECFDLEDEHDRLYQIRNDINHGNVDAENPDEQIRIETRMNCLQVMVLQMFGCFVPYPAPAPPHTTS